MSLGNLTDQPSAMSEHFVRAIPPYLPKVRHGFSTKQLHGFIGWWCYRDPREELKAKVKAKKAASAESKRRAYTLKDLCTDYIELHLENNTKKKGAEVLRMFETDVYPKYGSKPALEVTKLRPRINEGVKMNLSQLSHDRLLDKEEASEAVDAAPQHSTPEQRTAAEILSDKDAVIHTLETDSSGTPTMRSLRDMMNEADLVEKDATRVSKACL